MPGRSYNSSQAAHRQACDTALEASFFGCAKRFGLQNLRVDRSRSIKHAYDAMHMIHCIGHSVYDTSLQQSTTVQCDAWVFGA